MIHIFFIVLICFICLLLKVKEKKHGPLPPGPIRWPIFGSIIKMWQHKPYFKWMLSVCEGKDITCIRLGNTHVVVVNSPVIACEFLKENDAMFASRPMAMSAEYSGKDRLSVVVAPFGDQWKKMRQVIASTLLSPTKLRKQVNLRTEEADHLLSFIWTQIGNKERVYNNMVDIRFVARDYCGNVIRRIIFGRRWFGECQSNAETEHVEAAFSMVSLIFSFCTSDFLPWLRWLDLEGHESEIKRHIRVIDGFHDPIIYYRLKLWRTGGKKEVEDALDAFITLKDEDDKPLLTVEEIRAQCAELVCATVDNPSNIAEWALAHLLDNPEIYKRAVEELDKVVGRSRLVQESDFPNLPYIKAIVRETTRLHPVAAFNLPHVAISDATVCGYFIPKGTHVLLSRVGIGRNPKIWPDPCKFDPERHLSEPDISMADPQLRFISFTRGRRGCMGYELGSLMTYMLVSRLIQGFEWSLPIGEKLDFLEEEESFYERRRLYACARPKLSHAIFDEIIGK